MKVLSLTPKTSNHVTRLAIQQNKPVNPSILSLPIQLSEPTNHIKKKKKRELKTYTLPLTKTTSAKDTSPGRQLSSPSRTALLQTMLGDGGDAVVNTAADKGWRSSISGDTTSLFASTADSAFKRRPADFA